MKQAFPAGRRARFTTVPLTFAAIAGLTLAGCSAPGSGNAPAENEDFEAISETVTPEQVADLGDVSLSVWADQAEQPLMEELLPAFEEEYPNVTVTVDYRSFDDLISTVVNAAASSSPPDLFQGNIGYAVDGALVRGNLVRPLDDVAEVYGWTEDSGANTLGPARWNDDGSTFGSGTLYGMSPISEVQGIYYNESKLEELGLEAPASIEDIEAGAAVAQQAGEQAIMLGNADQYAGTHIFSDIAATTQDTDDIAAWIGGEEGATFETEGNVEAAQTMADWASAGYFGSGYDGLSNQDAITRFADGEGVFFVGGSWNGAFLEPDEFGFGTLTSGGVGATASPWHISSTTENDLAAIALLDTLRSAEAAQLILDTGRLPVMTDDVTAEDPLQEQTLTALQETIAAGTQVGYYDWATTDMLSQLGGALQEVMAGRISPTEFTERVQATWAEANG